MTIFICIIIMHNFKGIKAMKFGMYLSLVITEYLKPVLRR